VLPLPCFHHTDSMPLPTACKGETVHHYTSSLAAALPVPAVSLSHSHLWQQAPPVKHLQNIAATSLRGFGYSQDKPRDEKQHKTSIEKPPGSACPCPASSHRPSLLGCSGAFTQGQENKHEPASLRNTALAQQLLSEGFAAPLFGKNTQKAENLPKDVQNSQWVWRWRCRPTPSPPAFLSPLRPSTGRRKTNSKASLDTRQQSELSTKQLPSLHTDSTGSCKGRSQHQS